MRIELVVYGDRDIHTLAEAFAEAIQRGTGHNGRPVLRLSGDGQDHAPLVQALSSRSGSDNIHVVSAETDGTGIADFDVRIRPGAYDREARARFAETRENLEQRIGALTEALRLTGECEAANGFSSNFREKASASLDELLAARERLQPPAASGTVEAYIRCANGYAAPLADAIRERNIPCAIMVDPQP